MSTFWQKCLQPADWKRDREYAKSTKVVFNFSRFKLASKPTKKEMTKLGKMWSLSFNPNSVKCFSSSRWYNFAPIITVNTCVLVLIGTYSMHLKYHCTMYINTERYIMTYVLALLLLISSYGSSSTPPANTAGNQCQDEKPFSFFLSLESWRCRFSLWLNRDRMVTTGEIAVRKTVEKAKHDFSGFWHLHK